MGKNDKSDKSDDSRSSTPREYERKQLLAHMASRIVVTVMQDPSPSTDSPEAFAEVSVDIAEAILQKVGL